MSDVTSYNVIEFQLFKLQTLMLYVGTHALNGRTCTLTQQFNVNIRKLNNIVRRSARYLCLLPLGIQTPHTRCGNWKYTGAVINTVDCKVQGHD